MNGSRRRSGWPPPFRYFSLIAAIVDGSKQKYTAGNTSSTVSQHDFTTVKMNGGTIEETFNATGKQITEFYGYAYNKRWAESMVCRLAVEFTDGTSQQILEVKAAAPDINTPKTSKKTVTIESAISDSSKRNKISKVKYYAKCGKKLSGASSSDVKITGYVKYKDSTPGGWSAM